MLASIKKWHLRIDVFFASISAGLVLFMAVWGTVDVISRYFFNSPIPGTYEGMKFLLGAVAFFAFPYVQYTRGHIAVSIFRERLSGKRAALVDIISLTLMLAISIIIGWLGGSAAVTAWQRGDATMGLVEWPKGPAMMVVPIGCGLICLRLLSQIFGVIAGFSKINRNNRLYPNLSIAKNS